jgi:hypothetical protein
MDRIARRGTIKPKWVAPIEPKDPYRSIFIFKNNNHGFGGLHAWVDADTQATQSKVREFSKVAR